MKKILLLFVIIGIKPMTSFAQPKVCVEANFFTSDVQIPGFYGTYTKKVTENFLLAALGIAEYKEKEFVGKLALGGGFRKKTWAAMLMGGMEKTPKGEFRWLVSPWFYWKSRNGRWTTNIVGIIAHESDAIVELWHCSEYSNCELLIGAMNFEGNVGPAVKYIFAKKKAYAFVNATFPIFTKHSNDHGGQQDVEKWFPKVTTNALGLHGGIGIEIF